MTTAEEARILIIDDNPAIHEDFRKVLTSIANGTEVDEIESAFFDDAQQQQLPAIQFDLADAYQGQEGLDLLVRSIEEDRPFDMAFVDMRMPPGWDGLETIKNLWERDPDLQVVVCTAFSDHSWSDFRTQFGIKDGLVILKKPFDHAEVLQLACAMTKKRKLIRLADAKMATLEKIVSERTDKLEHAYQESERMLSAISSLLIGIDAHGKVHRWNENATLLFGVQPTDALGACFSSLPIAWDQESLVDDLIQSHDQQGTQRLEAVFTDSAGELRTVGLSAYPVFNNNVWDGHLILGSDITEQKSLEIQLRHAQKLESVGQLAAGVAHEINTPMQYLGDNLEFLQKKMDKLGPVVSSLVKFLESTEERADGTELVSSMAADAKKAKLASFVSQAVEAISDSRDGVQHVSRIVRAMKEFAHPGQEEKAPVNINRALESTIAVSTNEWKYVAVIETNFDTSIPLIPAFAGELNQVFLNIVVNAAHAIGDANDGGASGRGTITISTQTVDGRVEVSISDTGPGIPDKIKQRIFDPFFTTKEVGKGTGQGLAIAYSVVVQKLGGRLWCETTVGSGTTFFIQLPIEAVEKTSGVELETTLALE